MPRVMAITTPLGEDVLLFHGMHAREEISRVSEYELVLLSQRGDISLDEILGQNVTVTLALPDDETRYFNGYVTRFSQSGTYGRYHRYYAVVKPWLWFLSRTTDCRIFQDMTVPQIVKSVFADHSMADFKDDTTQAYRTWNYCVQYRETDLNFVSRLMEHEGIYYYLKHADGKHTLVMADSYSGHETCPGAEQIPFVPPDRLVRPDVEHIGSWEVTREIQPGVYVHDDYDLERPSVELRTRREVAWAFTPGAYEIYDYPGQYAQKGDGEQLASVRIEEFAAQYEKVQAATNVRALRVGYLFTLDGCPRADQNREHLVTSASYDLEYSDYEAMPDRGGADYRCSFEAISSRQQFRPRRVTPKPFVQGPQTAMVVGPAGDEIYTDAYGRVKVQFHWDRQGTHDENSSCWIRVSQPWAGKGWGSVATPRIGQEVIVAFLEGDPDQPIIVGRVYNAECQPPFGFPAGAVISGIKSQTHQGDGYNEMSFDDTAGVEKITIHGQYDMHTTVEHDQTTTVHNNRTDRIDVDDSESVGNNQTWDVGVNRDTTIGSNETLRVGANRSTDVTANETIAVGGNRSSSVGGSETAKVALQRTHLVGVNETIGVGGAQEIGIGGLQAVVVGAVQTITVGASQSTSVAGSQSTKVGATRSVSVGGTQTTSVTSNASLKVGGNLDENVAGNHLENVSKSLKVSAGEDAAFDIGKNLNLVAGEQIVLKTGSASIIMKKDGTIEIKGKDIKIEGSGKVIAKAGGELVLKGQSKITMN